MKHLKNGRKEKRVFCWVKISIIISESYTINKFQDKWETYKFFKEIGIRTPKTSLEGYSL